MDKVRIVVLHPFVYNLFLTGSLEIRDDDDGGGMAENAAYLLDLHGLRTVDGTKDTKLAISHIDALIEAIDSNKAVDFAFVELVEIAESYFAVDSWDVETF